MNAIVTSSSQTDSTPPGTRQTPAAYASPQDPDQPDYPMINFCEDFFNAFSLQTAIEYATSAGYPGKLNMAYYVNRAHLIFVSGNRVPGAWGT